MAKTGKKDRMQLQPPGMPQGNHMVGFKGMKVDEGCMCGSCHPNAQAGKKKTIYMVNGKQHKRIAHASD